MAVEDDFCALCAMLLPEELQYDPDLPEVVIAYWSACSAMSAVPGEASTSSSAS